MSQIQGFLDESEQAYGTVIFLHWKLADGSYRCVPVNTQAFFAPLRKQSIPRLELVLLSARTNVRHMCKGKRSSIFIFLRDQNGQFYFLQEIYSEQKDEKAWRNEWGGDIFFSHGLTHSRGVCFLINPTFRHTIEICNKDRNGRNLSIALRTGIASISLCNIYARNDLQQQLGFFCVQFKHIFGIQYGYWKPHCSWRLECFPGSGRQKRWCPMENKKSDQKELHL